MFTSNVVKLVSFDLFVEIFVKNRGDASKVGTFTQFLESADSTSRQMQSA